MLLTAVATSSFAKADDLQTLKNMERERAGLIQYFLDDSIDADKRRENTEVKTRRLVDLERMVMRDKRLEGNTHILVRRAFDNYELTFLAHSSVEAKTSVMGLWFDKVGLKTDDIMSATRGIR